MSFYAVSFVRAHQLVMSWSTMCRRPLLDAYSYYSLYTPILIYNVTSTCFVYGIGNIDQIIGG